MVVDKLDTMGAGTRCRTKGSINYSVVVSIHQTPTGISNAGIAEITILICEASINVNAGSETQLRIGEVCTIHINNYILDVVIIAAGKSDAVGVRVYVVGSILIIELCHGNIWKDQLIQVYTARCSCLVLLPIF